MREWRDAYEVSNSDDLGEVMVSYLEYFTATEEITQVRWLSYVDAISKEKLLTGCLALYDPTVSTVSLLGVVCMDISLMMRASDLEARVDYTEVARQIDAQAQQCSLPNFNAADLRRLRAQKWAESKCECTQPDVPHADADFATGWEMPDRSSFAPGCEPGYDPSTSAVTCKAGQLSAIFSCVPNVTSAVVVAEVTSAVVAWSLVLSVLV